MKIFRLILLTGFALAITQCDTASKSSVPTNALDGWTNETLTLFEPLCNDYGLSGSIHDNAFPVDCRCLVKKLTILYTPEQITEGSRALREGRGEGTISAGAILSAALSCGGTAGEVSIDVDVPPSP